MKNAITYSISLRSFLPRILLVATLIAIAAFYADHTDRLITVSFMIFGFVLLFWIGTRFLEVKINEKSLQGLVFFPIPRARILAWEDIESVSVSTWSGLKCYILTTKKSSSTVVGVVGVPFHLNNKRDFKNKVASFSGKDSPLSLALGNEL